MLNCAEPVLNLTFHYEISMLEKIAHSPEVPIDPPQHLALHEQPKFVGVAACSVTMLALTNRVASILTNRPSREQIVCETKRDFDGYPLFLCKHNACGV